MPGFWKQDSFLANNNFCSVDSWLCVLAVNGEMVVEDSILPLK
jgi:hypothetical protein